MTKWHANVVHGKTYEYGGGPFWWGALGPGLSHPPKSGADASRVNGETSVLTTQIYMTVRPANFHNSVQNDTSRLWRHYFAFLRPPEGSWTISGSVASRYFMYTAVLHL